MDDNKDRAQANTSTDDNGDRVKKLEEKVAELENNWKRALADYKNLERRTAEEKQEFAEFANMVLIQRLLPIVDNLQMLEKHISDTGLKMVIKEFKQVLENCGAVAMESQGKDFNADTMDCIETQDCDDDANNKVLEVTTEGYKFKNKILRPAKVRVGKAKNGKNTGN
jgi:molecular chaperone GrpE